MVTSASNANPAMKTPHHIPTLLSLTTWSFPCKPT